MSYVLRILFVILAALASASAFAQACNLADPRKVAEIVGYDQALALFKDRTCIGAPDVDDAPLVKDFDKLLAKSNAAEQRFADSIAALKLLARQAADRGSGARGEDWAAISAALHNSAETLAEVSKDTSRADAMETAERAIPKAWENIDARASGPLVFHGRRVQLLMPTGCNPKAPPCETFNNQLEMIRVVNLAVRLRDLTQRESLLLHVQDARLQTARWEAYRSKGQHQHFWEVFVNGLFMDEKLCPKDSATGIQRGFCAVPTSQWIILHPDAGLRWVRTANDSSELKAAFIVEMVGYYRWDWKSEKSAEMRKNFGASIVAAYTDVDTGRRWSYGPMIHFGSGYNFAATKASGEKWSFLINVNLAERYFGRKQEYTDYLKALKKPGFGALLQ